MALDNVRAGLAMYNCDFRPGIGCQIIFWISAAKIIQRFEAWVFSKDPRSCKKITQVELWETCGMLQQWLEVTSGSMVTKGYVLSAECFGCGETMRARCTTNPIRSWEWMSRNESGQR